MYVCSLSWSGLHGPVCSSFFSWLAAINLGELNLASQWEEHTHGQECHIGGCNNCFKDIFRVYQNLTVALDKVSHRVNVYGAAWSLLAPRHRRQDHTGGPVVDPVEHMLCLGEHPMNVVPMRKGKSLRVVQRGCVCRMGWSCWREVGAEDKQMLKSRQGESPNNDFKHPPATCDIKESPCQVKNVPSYRIMDAQENFVGQSRPNNSHFSTSVH